MSPLLVYHFNRSVALINYKKVFKVAFCFILKSVKKDSGFFSF